MIASSTRRHLGSQFCGLLPLAVCLAAHAQSGITGVTDTEFMVSADFDGDTRPDTALIDRATGTIRIAYQSSPGAHDWFPGRSTGLRDISGVSSGRLLSLGRDALVVTSPSANRLLVFDLPATTTPAVAREIFIPGIGPVFPVAVPLPGPGDTAFEDLVTASLQNGAKPQRITRTRNQDGNTFSTLEDATPEPKILGLQRLSSAASFWGYTVADRDGDQARVQIFNTSVAPVTDAWTVTQLPPSGHHLVATFTGGTNHHLIGWEPGRSQLSVAALENGVPNVPAAETDTLAIAPLDQVLLLPQPKGPPLVLVLSTQPPSATVLDFDGVQTWNNRATLAPPVDGSTRFTTASALADGSFLLLAGLDGRSTVFQRVARQGDALVAGPWSALPTLPGAYGGGNVLEFASEPFVSPTPGLLRSRNIPDWTTAFSLSAGPPTLKVVAESFLGTAPGLDTPTSATLGSPHAQTLFGLVNQVSQFLSIYSLAPAYGDVVSEVSIRPSPGRYKTGVAFSFVVANPLHTVRYQLQGAGDWIPFTGTPIALAEDTTVRFYAQPPLGTARSAIQTVRYEFNRPPATLDSNADGLPDFVALGKKLDPHSDGDSDDDGVSDLRELLSETDPLDPNSKPNSDALLAPAAGRILTLRPRPTDPGTGGLTVASTGSTMRIYHPAGGLLGSSSIAHPPAASATNSARIAGVSVDSRLPLLIAATDPHYPIETTAADRQTGRELVALLTPAHAPPVPVAYVYGSAGGSAVAEANGWIAAAKGVATPVLQPPVPPRDITPLDALATRLAEAWVAGALWARGFSEATNLTLLPFRAGEAGRWSPPQDLLQALTLPAPATPPPGPSPLPYVPPHPVLVAPSFALAPFSPATNAHGIALRHLTESIYLLNARSNNLAPGRYDPPLDVLRQFIWTGSLPDSYLQDLGLPGAELIAAQNGVLETLAGVPVRTPTNLVLRLRSDSFTGPCLTLERAVGAPNLVSLFDANGTTYKLPESFDLPTGTLLAVHGFTTPSPTACDGLGLEVATAQVVSIPAVPLVDANGNLLPDDWERLFLGGLADGPFADTDKDGYSDVQEMQEGSDPTDPANAPVTAPLALAEPELEIALSPSGEVQVLWKHAPAFGRSAGPAWQFALLGAPTLEGPFTLLASRPAEPDGEVQLALPAPSDAVRFFRLQLQLVRR